MTNPENDGSNYSELAEQIRNAGKQPHSGNVPVEQGGERPVNEYPNTPLEEAVGTHIDPANPPEDLSTLELQPHEVASADQAVTQRRATLPPATPPPVASPETPSKQKHTGRNVAIGTTLAAVLLGGVGYLGFGRGHDESHDATEPNTEPTASAPATPGNTTSPSTETSPSTTAEAGDAATTPLDSSVDGSMKPLTDYQLEEQHQLLPKANIVDKTLAANIDPQYLQAATNNGLYDQLINSGADPNDNGDELRKFHDLYTPDGIAKILGDQNLLDDIYNHQAEAARLYSQPQGFHSSETLKQLGKFPAVPVAMFKQAAESGDFSAIAKAAFPDSFGPAFLGELQAGNTDPHLVDTFVKLATVGNESKGALQAQFEAANFEAAERTQFQQIFDSYQDDPKQAVADMSQSQATPKLEKAKVLNFSEQQIGYDFNLDQPKIVDPNTQDLLAATTLYNEYSANGMKFGTISVVAWVSAPVNGDRHQTVTPVLLDKISWQYQ